MHSRAVLLCAVSTAAGAWSIESPPSSVTSVRDGGFASLQMHIEVDATNIAAEVSLEVESDEGLRDLTVFDPRGRAVLGMISADAGELGIAEAKVESEALSLIDVKLAFPEGTYEVVGTTVGGARLTGLVVLEHEVPARFRVLSPGDGEIVDPSDAVIAWNPAQGAARYFLEIEQDDLEFSLELTVPVGDTSFQIPPGLLRRGVDYEYSLVAQGDNDNETEIEGSFSVAK